MKKEINHKLKKKHTNDSQKNKRQYKHNANECYQATKGKKHPKIRQERNIKSYGKQDF